MATTQTLLYITRRTGFRVLITFLSRTLCVCVAVFQFTLFPISSACRIFSLMPWCSSAKNSVFKTIHNVIPSSKSGSLTICYGKQAKKRNRTEKENTKANKLNKCILTSFTILSVARSFLSLSSATGYKMSVCLCVWVGFKICMYILKTSHFIKASNGIISHTLYKQFWNCSHVS